MPRGRLAILPHACALALLLASASRALAAPTFSKPFLEWPSGFENRSMAVADFDGDGRPDVVLSESFPTSDLVFLRQNADHTFSEAGRWSPPEPMDQLCVGDFDGDGELDVAGLGGAGDVVYATFGDGAFGSTGFVTRTAPLGSIFLAKADLNGGSDDLVAVSYSASQLQTYTGLVVPIGETLLQSTIASPSGLAVGDVDGDGDEDIVLPSEFSGAAQVLYSDFAGGIASTQTLSGAPNLGTSALVVNLDGVGPLDIAIGGADGTGVALYIQSTVGTFESPVYVGASPAAVYFRLRGGDLDGDTDLDLVAFGPSSQVIRNDGAGNWSVPNEAFPTGLIGHSSAALLDYDGDGSLDILGHGNFGSGLLTARGNGDCTFESDQRIPLAQSDRVVFLDRDHDGDEDLVSVSTSGELQFYDRAGQTLTQYAVAYTGTPSGLVAADFNGDGWEDIATIDAWTGDVAVFLNDGGGGFPLASFDVLATGQQPISIAAGDLDGDGRDDIVLACSGGIETKAPAGETRPRHVAADHGVMVFFAQDPGFAPPVFVPAASQCPNHVNLADLDGDGRRDIVASMSCGSAVWIIPCTNTATLGAPIVHAIGNVPSSTEIANLDADADPDLLVMCSDNVMHVVPNTGSLTFGPSSVYSTPPLSNRAVVADFDQDGDTDVVTHSGASVLAVYPGLPGGTLGDAQHLGTAPASYMVLANDFDGDTDLDVLTCSASQLSLQFHRNALFATTSAGARPDVTGALSARAPVPNPARGTTTLEFSLANAASTSAEVLDLGGRVVRRLMGVRALGAGSHFVRWDLRDTAGSAVRSGVYFLRVRAGSHTVTRKVLVTR